MRISIFGKLLLVGACIALGLPLRGQRYSPEMQTSSRLEVAFLYSPLLTNVVRTNQFWMEGGSVQVSGQFWRGWGVMADVSGFHTQNAGNSGVGLDMVTSTFGPRYRWSAATRRYALFGQALAGEANGFNSVFPAPGAAISSARSLALQMGGGMDVPIKSSLSLRVFEADWLRTQLPNSETNTQNNVRLAAGVVVRFQ
jgi:hypothetical protein